MGRVKPCVHGLARYHCTPCQREYKRAWMARKRLEHAEVYAYRRALVEEIRRVDGLIGRLESAPHLQTVERMAVEFLSRRGGASSRWVAQAINRNPQHVKVVCRKLERDGRLTTRLNGLTKIYEVASGQQAA